MTKTEIGAIREYLNNKNLELDSSVLDKIVLLKNKAIANCNEKVANELYLLQSIFNIQNNYIQMYNLLKNNSDEGYEKSWILREKIDIQMQIHRNSHDYNYDFAMIKFIDEAIKRYKYLYPYKLFSSREMVIKKERCSICGKVRSIRNNCEHIPGKIYMGQMCYSIVEDAELKGFAIVENPEDDYTFLKLEGTKFNYEVLNILMRGLNSPFDRWDLNIINELNEEYKKIGRNELCPCGSGKKYKKCCLGTEKASIQHFEIIFKDNPNPPMVKPHIINKILVDERQFLRQTINTF